MTRQYKTMQSEMGLRIHTLEVQLERVNKQLGKWISVHLSEEAKESFAYRAYKDGN